MSRLSRKIRNWAVEALDLPGDLVFDLPRLTMIGNKQLLVENHQGVLHFSPEELQLELKQGILKVEGTELAIRTIMPEEVIIEGRISGIKYEGVEE
ncbi:sporulation protein YqfC [Paenibacillus fonticola]|uniref:sporulation protein YqfC n=1 Tax=Paenibacillus fonticola TaxID=379896 RepID=UPI00035E65DA|nr:sporulation protein YqfC [Paenibacillus fonticola]